MCSPCCMHPNPAHTHTENHCLLETDITDKIMPEGISKTICALGMLQKGMLMPYRRLEEAEIH